MCLCAPCVHYVVVPNPASLPVRRGSASGPPGGPGGLGLLYLQRLGGNKYINAGNPGGPVAPVTCPGWGSPGQTRTGLVSLQVHDRPIIAPIIAPISALPPFVQGRPAPKVCSASPTHRRSGRAAAVRPAGPGAGAGSSRSPRARLNSFLCCALVIKSKSIKIKIAYCSDSLPSLGILPDLSRLYASFVSSITCSA